MEKNAIVAIILSMLVLLVWSFFFAPKPAKKASEQAEAPISEQVQDRAGPQATTGPTEAAPLEQADTSVISQPQAAAQREIRNVVVETNLFWAVLTEDKAALKSIKLKKYRTEANLDAAPLELNKSGYPNLILSLYRNSVAGFDAAIYEADKLNLKLTSGNENGEINFRWESPDGITFVKTYKFRADEYDFDVDITVENRSQRVFDDNIEYTLIGAPFEKKTGMYGSVGMISLCDGSLKDKETKKVEGEMALPGTYTWIGYQDNYFLSALVPWEPLKTSLRLASHQKGVLNLTIANPPLKLGPMQKASLNYKAYMGPKDLGILRKMNLQLDKAVHFGWFNFIGKPLLWFLNYIKGIVHNYGVAIIILTICVKIIFWPLTQKSYKSMKAMQKLQPHMQKIREKYKDNKEKLNQEMMALYKTHKVNPMGGCLPMIIQIPVFFALYRVLGSSIEIRHAPFMLWIKDLSAPDRLNIGFDLPYVGGLPVLTLLMGASMFLQQKMTPTTGDPTQAKIMMMMPLIFTFMFINFPAGLVLYWLTNNVLSIGQQYMINKGK